MGIFDTFADLIAAAAPWSEAEAEAPQDAGTDEQNDEGGVKSDSEEKEEEAGAEEEEEEEEEMVDPKETFEEECRESKACAPAKHHFDDCVDRVTTGVNKLSPNEDCVEEFFHLTHCATECAAPKLWKVLK
ncbi:uncharacterized protein BP5553_03801 [Venustampulla echinocandica]|uniref:Cytochrome b-c1 complex subunit 6, mitochondrial n=1 Tax=Venustampulla echinocandica TaxID=2656787 RepID=A0A370TVB4_9HELO|nr:uncharacterized protein BP5553_03801 [Venustampulla echinocandica]RDL39461.1 hypothetical protein BP5553_03801 [Venustampulla echinocandica]